jgi:hypothetical protein
MWLKKFNRPLEVKSKEIMLAMTPVIRETEEELDSLKNYALRPTWQDGEVSRVVNDVGYFTHKSFHEFIKELKQNNINYILINAVPQAENDVMIPFIRDYVQSKEYAEINN